jgi:gamma-glutamyltranspeptidase/glutathione hydrolase/leukotriene-C4 hydrolase
LKGFKALAYPPIHQTWNGKTVYTTSAPSSGAMLLAILNILEGFDFPSTPKSEGGCNGPRNIHRFLEAMKFAFGARSEVTDPAYATSEQKDRYMEFTTKKWAKEARHKITVSLAALLMDDGLMGRTKLMMPITMVYIPIPLSTTEPHT